MARPVTDVFGYLDYRAFLRDLYAAKKAMGRGFSFRVFSRRAGLKSPNYLKLVMDGQRNLTTPMAERFAEACELEGESARYFCDLVAFNQAKTAAERSDHYGKLVRFRKFRAAQKLELAHAAYHAHWYVPAIRELATAEDFVAEPAVIARRLTPGITEVEAARALEVLLQLGLLVRDEAGRVRQADALVTTGAETRGVHLRAYHRAMIQLGAEAIDRFGPEERDVSSLTLCLGERGLGRLKERLQNFRRELLEWSALESDGAEVVQVNFQLFPLSKPGGTEAS